MLLLKQKVKITNLTNIGITSMHAGMDRYALGQSGCAINMYRTRKLRKYQYYSCSNWNGGLYVTPNMTGSRYASALAFTWTKMLSTGLNGYYEKADAIIGGAHQLRGQFSKLKQHVELITPTTLSIFAFKLRHGDTYDLGDYLRSQGWNVKNTINPIALSFIVADGKLPYII
jgi:sphinganine-1-phosphate aldolase